MFQLICQWIVFWTLVASYLTLTFSNLKAIESSTSLKEAYFKGGIIIGLWTSLLLFTFFLLQGAGAFTLLP